MTTTEIANSKAVTLEAVLLDGNLARLSPDQRVSYYNAVCESIGLNPLTKPFAYITLNGKLTLYALRDATEQLRKLHGVSIAITARELVDGCYVVTARASDAKGRQDESIGVVPLTGLQGEAKANALMKAETKAKRRVTLSICGLGMLDESEADSILDARKEPPPQLTPTAKPATPAKALTIEVVPAPAPAPAPLPTIPSPPITGPQLKRLQAVVTRLPLAGDTAEARRAMRIAWLRWAVGRDTVNSTTDLSTEEASHAIDLADRGEMPREPGEEG